MRASFALVVVTALVALLAASSVSAAFTATIDPGSLVFSTSEFDTSNIGACVGFATIDELATDIAFTGSIHDPLAPPATLSGYDCPDIQYPNGTTEGIAINIAAIDPALDGGRLYFVEGQEDGSNVLAYSSLADRSTVIRTYLDQAVVAMSMGLPDALNATPLLLLTTTPTGMSLREKDVLTSIESNLVDEVGMEGDFDMTHAVAGALVLNDVKREVYWLGLSGSTMPFDATKLFVFALSLDDTTKSKVVSLEGCPDVLSLHFSASLNALVIVTSADVRVAPLPATALTASTQTQLDTFSVFDYEGHWHSDFDSLQLSSAWIADARQLVLGVNLTQGERIVTLTLGETGPTTIELVGSVLELPVKAGTELPLFFTGGVSQLLITDVPESVALNAGPIPVDGFGFAQPLVTAELKCQWSGQLADGQATAPQRTDASQVYNANANSASTVRVSCPLPSAPALPFNTVKLTLRLTGLTGLVSSQSVEIDINECAGGSPFPATCTTPGLTNCTNILGGGGAACTSDGLPLPGSSSTGGNGNGASSSSGNGNGNGASSSSGNGNGNGASSSSSGNGNGNSGSSTGGNGNGNGNGASSSTGGTGPVCSPGHATPPACDVCAKGYYKETSSGAACTKCPVGQTTTATGSTSKTDCSEEEAPCDLTLVNGDGEGNLDSVANGGANVPVRLQMRKLVSLEVWNYDAAASALEFRTEVAMMLELYLPNGEPDLRRIGQVESVVPDQWLPDMAVVITFLILPAEWEDQQACRNGTSTGNNGKSPGDLGGKLVNMPGSNTTVILDHFPAPVLSKMSMSACVESSLPGLLVLAGLLIVTGMTYCVASMKPRLPRSRPWEVFPAALPLIAVGFDIWFMTKMGSLDPAVDGALLTPLFIALAAALLVVGVVLNTATILYYANQQTRKATVMPVTLRMTAEGEVKKSVHLGNTTQGHGPSVLNMWRAATPTGSQVAFVAGALNVNALGMCSSRLTSRHAVWHIKFDRSRSGMVGYHALLRKAGFRSLLVRTLPMLILQVVLLMELNCPLWALAPIIANALSIVAIVGRLLYLTTEEPAVSDVPVGGKYVLRARRQGPDGNWVESDNGNGTEYVETDSSENSRNSRTSSRSGWARAGSLAGGLKKIDGEEEGGFRSSGSPQLAAAGDMNAAAGLPHMPMEVGTDGMVEVEMSAEEEAELAAAGLNAHAWQLAGDVDNQLEGGGVYARYKRRMTQIDAEAVMARRARANAQAMLARKAAAIPAAVVQRTMAAAKEAREVLSNAHVWLLFDEPSVSASGDALLAPLPRPVGPDQVVRAVEQFHPETGMPYSPAMFKRYVASKAALEKVTEARKAEAEKPEVKARVEKAKQAEAEIASEADVWIMLDDSKEAAAGESLAEHGAVDIKEIEVFTEEGAPYDPAFFKRFVKKANTEAALRVAQKESMAAAAGIPVAAALPMKPSTPSSKRRLAPLVLSSPSEAQERINARAAESEVQASASVHPRKESVSTKGHDSTSKSSSSTNSNASAASSSAEPGAADKEATRVEINERLAMEAAAERAAVDVREVDGARDVVASSGPRNENGEDAAVIGELNLGQAASAPASLPSPVSKAQKTPEHTPSMSRLLSGSRLGAARPRVQVPASPDSKAATAQLVMDAELDAEGNVLPSMQRAGSAWGGPKASGAASAAAAALVSGSHSHSGSHSGSASRSPSYSSASRPVMHDRRRSSLALDGEGADIESAEVIEAPNRRGARAALLAGMAAAAEKRAAALGHSMNAPGSPNQMPAHLRSPSAVKGAGASEAPMSPMMGSLGNPALPLPSPVARAAAAAKRQGLGAAGASIMKQ